MKALSLYGLQDEAPGALLSLLLKKSKGRCTTRHVTVFAKPAVLEVNLGLI